MTHRRSIVRNIVAGMLVAAAMVTAAGPAFAVAGDPIPDIDVKIGKNPSGSVSVNSTGVSVSGFGPSINIFFRMTGGGGTR